MSLADAAAFQQAIEEKLPTANTARALYELHHGRWLIGFDANPHLHVIAPLGTEPLGLAILLVEQMAIVHAQSAALQASMAITRLQDLPPASERLQ